VAKDSTIYSVWDKIILYTKYQCSVAVKEEKTQWIPSTSLDAVYCASSCRRFERYCLNTRCFALSKHQEPNNSTSRSSAIAPSEHEILHIALCYSTGLSLMCFNTLRTGLLNCLNARSRGLTFRHRASCI